MKIPVVALVGRPNVGKSTLFNRMVGDKLAIIENTPGVTRDRLYGTVKYGNHEFHLIDTGGIDLENSNFSAEIKVQAQIAIEEADVVLFVLDAKEGVTPNDILVKDMLIKSRKKIIAVINKTDSKESREHLYDFYELGFEHYFFVSGEQNEGIKDLMEETTKEFPSNYDEEDDSTIKFSLIGRPNVGKSSLVNALVGDERVIVSKEAGTTRDAIDTSFMFNDEKFTVIDTAGLRKRGKVWESIERYSAIRSLKAIDRSDVCVLILDATTGIIEHDKHIASYALDAGKAIIIVVNKWDTVKNKIEERKKWQEAIKANFEFMDYAPVLFMSALTTKRTKELMPEIEKAFNNTQRYIDQNTINSLIKEAYNLNLPPSYKGRRLKIYSAKQVGTKPPTFTIRVNDKGLVNFAYPRYLENKIRESYDFTGTPIVLKFKSSGDEKL